MLSLSGRTASRNGFRRPSINLSGCLKIHQENPKFMQQHIIQAFASTPIYTQSALYAFLNQSAPTEADVRYFLRWQRHFYHFVRVFSKMLARCAAEIEDTEHRLHLIGNLMCEHGLPEGRAHVTTYRQYLQCLAAHLGQEPFTDADFAHHPDDAVQALVRDFEQLPASGAEHLLWLGGIEYVYAVISRDVVALLRRIDPALAAQQEHYAIHAELDWEHGWEFVETYADLMQSAGRSVDEAQVLAVLQQGAQHLVTHIGRLMALENPAHKPLGFYYSREDVAVEAAVLQRFFPDATQLDVLAVCGGGENHIALANRFAHIRFDMDFIDINPNQLTLAEAKFAGVESTFRQPEHTAKFEHLFAELRRYADLRTACATVFHRDNLIAYFGEQAVLGCREAQHNPQVFAEHFYRALSRNAEHWNADNIVHGTPIQAALRHGNLHAGAFCVWDVAAQDNLPTDKRYHFIMLSNVPDWVAEDALPQVFRRLAAISRDDTVLLVRKLLSDYDMAALAAAGGWQIRTDAERDPVLCDPTGFYKQTFVLVRA